MCNRPHLTQRTEDIFTKSNDTEQEFNCVFSIEDFDRQG